MASPRRSKLQTHGQTDSCYGLQEYTHAMACKNTRILTNFSWDNLLMTQHRCMQIFQLPRSSPSTPYIKGLLDPCW